MENLTGSFENVSLYDEYMQSDDWRKVKAERERIDGHRCVVCGSNENLQCHHLTYNNLGHENVRFDLITMCRDCHMRLHNNDRIQSTKNKRNDKIMRYGIEYYIISKLAQEDYSGGGDTDLLKLEICREKAEAIINEVGYIGSYSVQHIMYHFAMERKTRIIECVAEGYTQSQCKQITGFSDAQISKYYKEVKENTMKNYDETYKNASANGNDMPAGGYILKIADAVDVPDKKYLRIELDVAEGEFKNYYFQLMTRASFWGLNTYKSYKEKNMGWFKQFMELLEKENADFKWDWDESKLIGKKIGGILRLEEYMANDGNVKASLKLFKTCSISDIESGNFVVPPIKKLETSATITGVVDNSAKPESFEELDEAVPF